MNEREEKMLEEIFRLEKELSKYKRTKERPFQQSTIRCKTELYFVDEFPHFPRVHFNYRNFKGQGKNIEKDLPLHTIVREYAMKLLEEEE